MLIPLSSPSLKYAPESLSVDGDEDCGLSSKGGDEDCGLSSKGSCRAREMCGEGPEPGPCSSLRLVGQTLTETHLPKPPMPPIALPSGPKTKPGATAASPRHEILRLLATGPSELDENGELCVIQGRLYLASLAGLPVPTAKKYFITLKQLRYIPFCADFGPFNLGLFCVSETESGSPCALPTHLVAIATRIPAPTCLLPHAWQLRQVARPVACRVRSTLSVRAGTVHHICQALAKTLLNPKLQDFRVVYYTSQDSRDVTNSIFLLGAFLCLHLGATPEEAWKPFQSLKDTSSGPLCLPYRDATWVKSSYDLHVKDCWAGLVRAVATSVYDLQAFDKHEVRCSRSAPAVLCTSQRPRLPRGDSVIRWCLSDMRLERSIFITMIRRKVTCTWWCRVSFWPSAVQRTKVQRMRPTTEAPFHRLLT
jgi:hypothetical protein